MSEVTELDHNDVNIYFFGLKAENVNYFNFRFQIEFLFSASRLGCLIMVRPSPTAED